MIFDWCKQGAHDLCKRKYQRFYFEKNRIVWLDEWRECACKAKSCPCSAHEGQKAVQKRRKRKQ